MKSSSVAASDRGQRFRAAPKSSTIDGVQKRFHIDYKSSVIELALGVGPNFELSFGLGLGLGQRSV